MRYVAILVCFALVACGDAGKEGGPGETPESQNPPPVDVPGPAGSGELPPADGSGALTDAQVEKFIAVAREVDPNMPSPPTAESLKAWQAGRAEVILRHGMTELEYGQLEVRMKTAVTMLGYGIPVPDELKADCEMAKKHLKALKSALRME